MDITPVPAVTVGETVFSPCRRYRYTLWRRWGNLFDDDDRFVMFVGLNPSTADEQRDDPTIARCRAFAQSWGFNAFCMTNLFAYRATNPQDMLSHPEPVGPDNDFWLSHVASKASLIVAAWGIYGEWRNRDRDVRRLLPNIHVLRLTKDGHPAHPLYLPKVLTPVSWPVD